MPNDAAALVYASGKVNHMPEGKLPRQIVPHGVPQGLIIDRMVTAADPAPHACHKFAKALVLQFRSKAAALPLQSRFRMGRAGALGAPRIRRTAGQRLEHVTASCTGDKGVECA